MTIFHKENEEISCCNLRCNDFTEKKNSNGSLQSTADNVFLDIANQIKRPISVCYGQFETGLSLVA